MNISYEIGTWCAAFLTLAVFSFLYGENPFYKLAEHLFVGLSAGYGVVIVLKETLWPNLLDPLFGTGAAATQPVSTSAWAAKVAWLVLSLLMFTKFSRKWRFLSDWPIAFIVGAFAGVSITALAQSDLVKQIQATMLPLWGPRIADQPWSVPVNNFLIIVGLLCSLAYFFFSVPHKGAMKVAARTGIYFLMVGFGASFGFTVMGRLSLTIGRALELSSPTAYHASHYAPWPAAVAAAIILVGLVVWHRLFRKTPPPAA